VVATFVMQENSSVVEDYVVHVSLVVMTVSIDRCLVADPLYPWPPLTIYMNLEKCLVTIQILNWTYTVEKLEQKPGKFS
jgi:hypothetical protein